MALEDELAKLTRRRGGPGRPAGQNRGVAYGVAAIGIGLLVIIAALFALSSLARTGPNEVGVVYNGGPARQEDPAPADPARLGADVDGLAVTGPAPVSLGGLAAALHHHVHAWAR